MAHERVYSICENKCWEETMTKEQIEKYAVTSDITETEIPVTEVYKYDGMGQEEFDQPEEYTVVDGHAIAYRQMFVHKTRHTYKKGDKFTFGEMGINSHGTAVGIYVLTEKTPGAETINVETDCVYQGKVFCAVENVYNTETIMFTQDCEGYLCIVFNPIGTVTMRIKELKVIKKPADLAQLRFKEYDIFPKTSKVIESETVPAEIVIGNREEIRFTGDAVSAAITVNPTISGNDYNAKIVVKTAFTGAMKASDFVGGSVVVANADADISACTVVHVNLNYDGTNVYAYVSGDAVSSGGGSGGSGVGQIDATSGAYYHGEIFNDYSSNKATGQNSHAEGQETTASGTAAHAEGYHTTASKYYTHSEGYYTNASGMSSHAEGDNTTASGDKSHAEGANTTASGSYSHAEGYNTTASGSFSHAEGSNTVASGSGTHAEGIGTKVSSAGQHVQGKFNIEDTSGTYAMIIGNGTNDGARSNALTVDWSGNVECGNINGVDVNDLLTRIIAIESQLSPVIENLFDTSMIYYMLTEAYVTHNEVNYYYASVDADNNVISFIYDAKGMKILNDGALFEDDTQYIIEADIKTSTASEGTDAGTSYNGCVEIQYSDKTKADALVNNTSEYTHVSYTTEAGKTVSNLYVKGDMVAGLNVDTILYIKNLVIRKA